MTAVHPDLAGDVAAGLFDAVLRFPEEDLPRLVYADYLDERAGSVPCKACGGPHPDGVLHGCLTCGARGSVPDGRAVRAAFIRAGCELAKPAPVCEWKMAGKDDCETWNKKRSEYRMVTWCPACAPRHALRAQEQELLLKADPSWWGGELLTTLVVDHGATWSFTRGFVSRISLLLVTLTADVARRLGETCPLTAVRLMDREPEDDRGWMWFCSGRTGLSTVTLDGPRATLPREFFDLLSGPEGNDWGDVFKGFDTRDAAMLALDTALANYCRSLAGFATH